MGRPPGHYGSNYNAAVATIRWLEENGTVTEGDAMAITNLLTLAKAVDAAPTAAMLRKEFREAEEALRRRHERDTDSAAGSEFLDRLRATMGDAPAQSTDTGRRSRQRADRAGPGADAVAEAGPGHSPGAAA